MAKSRLIAANHAIAEHVTSGFARMSDGVVNGFNKMSDGVVSRYSKIEDGFVDRYLTRDNETVPEAKARLKAAEAARRAKETR